MKIWIPSIFALAIIIVLTGFSFAQENNNAIELNQIDMSLLEGAASFLEAEAGISAYVKVSGVDLDLAEKAYKNIEVNDSQYIIGSVSLADYGEIHDVHVYVDLAGWMIAYYLNTEKASKIIDWKNYDKGQDISDTKLKDALRKVSDAMFVLLTDLNYYDFRTPNATKMMIVADKDKFNIVVPSEYNIYDRSWSMYVLNTRNAYIKIDTFNLTSPVWACGTSKILEGVIAATPLSPDVLHSISLIHDGGCPGYGNGYGYEGIVLLYAEPN